MYESISQYNNEVMLSAAMRTGFFSSKPRAVFSFISGKKLSITPTHSIGLNVILEMNGVSLTNPVLGEINSEIMIHGGMHQHIGSSSSGIGGVRLMRVQTIELQRHVESIVDSVMLKGDLDCDRLGKGLIFGAKRMTGVVSVNLSLFPALANLPMAFGHMRNQIGLVVVR